MNVNLLTLKENDIPSRLACIPSPPKKLYVIGNTDLLNRKYTLSVVGSRKVTAYGRQVTANLVHEVAGYGVVIISGLALGVDSIAHQAALDAGGETIAVLPAGLDNIYPSSHRNLAIRILERGGLLLSEYEPGMPALKQNFIARNRLVAGLGDGTLITEASRLSGTIHTANFALEQGKVVMAVPGNINSPQSEGTNNLISTGAVPIASATDILNALELEAISTEKEIFAANRQEQIIIDLLSQGITNGEELLIKSKLGNQEFSQTLTMLEITKKIRPAGSGHWIRY